MSKLNFLNTTWSINKKITDSTSVKMSLGLFCQWLRFCGVKSLPIWKNDWNEIIRGLKTPIPPDPHPTHHTHKSAWGKLDFLRLNFGCTKSELISLEDWKWCRDELKNVSSVNFALDISLCLIYCNTIFLLTLSHSLASFTLALAECCMLHISTIHK